jgi:hypothetical protein
MASPAETDTSTPLGRLSAASQLLARPVEALAFWLAVVLPLAYLPLLLAGGLSTSTLLGCLAVNALAHLLGHRHNRHRTTA